MRHSYIIKEDSNLFGKTVIIECYKDKELINYIAMGTIFDDKIPEMYLKAIDAIIKVNAWSQKPTSLYAALSNFDTCRLLPVGV